MIELYATQVIPQVKTILQAKQVTTKWQSKTLESSAPVKLVSS
jgi:hypothetical protein